MRKCVWLVSARQYYLFGENPRPREPKSGALTARPRGRFYIFCEKVYVTGQCKEILPFMGEHAPREQKSGVLTTWPRGRFYICVEKVCVTGQCKEIHVLPFMGEPATPWTEVASANHSATWTLLHMCWESVCDWSVQGNTAFYGRV